MCGRFSILCDEKSLAEHFALVNAGHYVRSYNVTPSSDIPVVRLDEDQNRELANCHWGLIPQWSKDVKRQPINARAETISEKPFFRHAFKQHRCLIPASGFYEWQGAKGHKQPYYFRLNDRNIFAFAGLWDRWESPDQIIESCTIITTVANDIMRPIHERMPVILDPEQYDTWLKQDLKEMLKPYAGNMICYPVSTKINSPSSHGPELIEPLK